MELRDYQIRAIEKLREVLRFGKRKPVMVLPTGGGKSVIFGQIIANIIENGKKVLWIVHRRNLVHQMKETLQDHFDIEAGIVMAGEEPDVDKKVQLCTVQTLSRRMMLDAFEYNPFMINADVVLIDEGHRSISPTYRKIIKCYEDRIIMACTATPMRADGRGLGEVYDSIVEIASVEELTNNGYLSPARYFAPVTIDLDGVKMAMGDYVLKELDKRVNKKKLIGDIIENWLKLAENRKTIVFAVNVKHSKALRDEFLRNNIQAEHLDARSSDDERNAVFDRMQRGDTTVICNVALYQEGLDVPDVGCIVMARPTKSMGLYRQCCGRGLRPFPGKNDTLILDHGGVIEEHGLLDWPIEWTLDGKERAWKKPKREKVEKLVKCRACHKVFTGARICPDCGTPVMSFGKKIETIEAELEETEKNQKASSAEKRKWYGMLMWYCREKGYKEGWTYWKYKEKFKVEPHHSIKDTTFIEPDQEFKNWIKHLNIKYAKRKKKEQAEITAKRGGELAEQYNLGLR